MKITYKHTLPADKLSKFDIHRMGPEAISLLVKLDHLKIVMASPHEKKVDLVVTNTDSKQIYKIKVLTTKNPSSNQGVGTGLSWMVGEIDKKTISDDMFFCFVHLVINKDELEFRFFIVPSKDVSEYVENAFNFWLNEVNTRDEKNTVKKFLLGEKGKEYPSGFKTLIQEDYEDNWDLLK